MTEKLMTEKWRAWFSCRDPTTRKIKMPIKVDTNIRHLDQAEFGEIAYQVMDHIFAVHNKMGRFLDEDIYRNAVAAHIGDDSQTEVRLLKWPITIGRSRVRRIVRCESGYWHSCRMSGPGSMSICMKPLFPIFSVVRMRSFRKSRSC